MESTSFDSFENIQENQDGKLEEVYNLSTNVYKQMDREKEEMEEETASTTSLDEILQLNSDLQTGYKILADLMSDSKKAVNWPFMESVETSAPELFDEYKKRIEKPMWLKLMKSKFEEKQYETITEFVADFRLMLENCYRFNGPDHYISRRGQKLETMLEQKLNLLSREMREKTSIEATSGLKTDESGSAFGMRRRHKAIVPHDSTVLLNQLREQEQQKVREYRRQQMLDRKAEKEALAQEILDWEEKVLFCGKYMEQMKAMWEIGLFLFLCQGPLNIGEVMHFELERCFLMPRESSTMQLIMMSLLSTPFQRQRIDRKFLMPYKVWEQKLRCKMQVWYKVYTDSGYDKEKACTKLGFDEKFFEIVGKKNPLDRKKYHELSYYKRVWVVKGLCDHILHTQESLRDNIELQPFPDQREYVLGTDAEGLRYIHFPQFCGADLRIYRQAPFKYPKIEIQPDHFDNKRKFPFVYKPPPMKKVKLKKKKSQKQPDKVSPSQSPMRQRPSRLRQTPKSIVPLAYGDSSESSSSDSDDDDEGNTTNNDTNTEVEESGGKEDSDDKNDLSGADIDNKSEDRLSSGSDATVPYCEGSDSLSSQSSPDCSRESSPYPTPTDLPSLGLRRSSRLDKSSDVSREASPMIDQLDFSSRKGGRNKSRFKNIPPVRATRDLTSFLLDENSTASNSSTFGESSNSVVWRKRLLQNENSVSSDTGEESNSCDINGLFTASKPSSNGAGESEGDSLSKDLTWRDLRTSNSKLGAKSEGNETDSPNLSDTNMCNGFSNKSDTNDEPGLPESKDSCKSDLEDNEEPLESKDTDSSKGSLNDNGEISNSNQTEIIENGDSKDCIKESINKTNQENQNEDDIDQDNQNDTSVEAMDLSDKTNDNERTESSNIGANIKANNTGTTGLNGVDKEEKNDSQDHTNLDTPHKDTLEENQTECDTEPRSQTAEHSKDESDIPNTTDECKKGLSAYEIHRHLDPSCPHTADSELHKDSDIEEMESESVDKPEAETIDEPDIKKELNEPNQTCKESSDSVENDSGALAKVKEEPMDTSECPIEAGTDQIKDQNHLECSEENIKSEDGVRSEISAGNSLESEAKSDVQNVSVKTEPTEDSVLDSGDIETKMKTESSLLKDEDKKEDVKGAIMKEEIKEESEEEEEEEQEPDGSEFQLLADNVDALRALTEQFAEQEPIVIKRGKKEQIMKPPPRKRNVVLLHDRLQYLLKELEPWEFKLAQATKRARLRLRKEMETYVEPPEEEDNKWNSADEETESGGSDDDDNEENKDDDKARRDDQSKKLKSFTDKVLSANNSRSSTPVKFEEPEEIDVSQRGRLRKRRIIPNNVEDQFSAKKARPTIKSEPSVTTQSTPVTTQPVIIQSGKPQMVDYSDILRQLRSASSSSVPGVSPILIKTTQGGRTVLTSVLPIVSGSKTSAPTSVAGAQNIRFLSTQTLNAKGAGQQPIKVALPVNAGLSSTKVSQHPTIQTLLSTTTTPGANVLPPMRSQSPLLQIATQGPNQNTGALSGIIQTASGQQLILKAQDQAAILAKQQTGSTQKIVLQSKTTPQKIVPIPQISHNQGAIQGHITPPKVGPDLQTTPRKIAPHTTALVDTTSKGKVKYYAANASTLPINVVQQLLATRGAKLQTGPNQQSILFIPMENEGQTRNVTTTTTKTTIAPVRHQFLSPVKTTAETGSVSVTGSSEDNTQTGTKPTTPNTKPVTQVTNTPILPKPQAVIGTQVVNLGPGIPFQASKPQITGNLANLNKVSKTVKLPDGSISLNVMARNLPPGSPPRYPTNETVRNLLDKRKSGEEKILPATTMTTYPCIASQLQGITPKPLNSSIILKNVSSSPEANTVQPQGNFVLSQKPASHVQLSPAPHVQISPAAPHVQISPAAPHVQISPAAPHVQLSPAGSHPQVSPAAQHVHLSPSSSLSSLHSPEDVRISGSTSLATVAKLADSVISPSLSHPPQPPQHCVITSISPAKLNTLLLQTSAAGAKTIPSLIKLPSKAVLDSAVKAVVTSVNTSLPTVNIKVPSPTSLPSIGPRRNVTKTIQTMKSPIPVAPRVVTQNSGMTTLSVANSSTTVLSSQSVGLSSGKALITTTNSTVGPAQQTVIQSIDGKKVVAKVTPQAVLTSKGIVQMGYITPQNMVLPKTPVTSTQSISTLLNQIGLQTDTSGNQSIQGMQLIQNSAGQIQLVPRNSQLLQQVAQKPNLLQFGASSSQTGQAPVTLQPIKQEHDAHSAIASHISKPPALYTATPIKSPVLGIPSSKSPVLTLPVPLRSPVLHSSNDAKPAAPSGAAGLASLGAGYLLPQSVSTLAPGQSPSVTQPPVSPLLNIQQNMLLQGSGGGLRLNSPVINPLGLLQQGVALQNTQLLPNSQNVNLLQNSLRSPGIQQMVNVNPLLLNNLIGSSSGVVAGRPPGPISSVSVAAGRVTNMVPSVPQAIQMTKPNILYQTNASSVLSGAAKQVANLVNRVPGMDANLAQPATMQANLQQTLGTTASTEPQAKQLIFQYNVANPRLPVTTVSQQTPSINVVKNLNTTFTNVGQDVKRIISPSTVLHSAMNTHEVAQPSAILHGQSAVHGSYQVHSASTSPTFATTASDQAQKTSPTHQKLLLFSIGGQLVTGQGVPVTLSDGVLKLMPQGKIQIANQTLTPAQIQQTLAKINQGLNVTPTSQPNVGAGQSQMAEQPSIKIVNNTATPAALTAIKLPTGQAVGEMRPTVQYKDHDYQHKDKAHTTGLTSTVNIPASLRPSIATSSIATAVAVAIEDAARDVRSRMEDKTGADISVRSQPIVKIEDGKCQNGASAKDGSAISGVPTYVKPRSKNTQYVMKPMVYSSGYIVCPKTDKDKDNADIPVVTDISKPEYVAKFRLMSDQDDTIIKGPVKTEVNGKTEMTSRETGSNDADNYEDDMNESSLVIDDSINEKEAAFNLLTLANQALAPVKIKTENPIDKAGDAPDDVNNMCQKASL